MSYELVYSASGFHICSFGGDQEFCIYGIIDEVVCECLLWIFHDLREFWEDCFLFGDALLASAPPSPPPELSPPVKEAWLADPPHLSSLFFSFMPIVLQDGFFVEVRWFFWIVFSVNFFRYDL